MIGGLRGLGGASSDIARRLDHEPVAANLERHVEKAAVAQTFFRGRRAEGHGIARERQLHAVVPEGGRTANACPGNDRLRRTPAELAHRGSGEKKPAGA